MKLFFLSDIHGSLFYLRKALEAFEKEKADRIVLLGDVMYHGPRNPLPKYYSPAEVANLLNTYKTRIIAVRGNCDSEVDQMLINYPMMSDYSSILYEGRTIFLSHGHLYNPESLPPLNKGDIFVFGHIHLPVLQNKDGVYIVNPGSISLPKENNPNSYCILENNLLQIKDLEGNTFMKMEI